MQKLTEIEKLKYWLDSEITITRAMLAFILMQIVTATWQDIVLGIYVVYNMLYAIVRIAYIYSEDRDYLKVPKK